DESEVLDGEQRQRREAAGELEPEGQGPERGDRRDDRPVSRARIGIEDVEIDADALAERGAEQVAEHEDAGSPERRRVGPERIRDEPIGDRRRSTVDDGPDRGERLDHPISLAKAWCFIALTVWPTG